MSDNYFIQAQVILCFIFSSPLCFCCLSWLALPCPDLLCSLSYQPGQDQLQLILFSHPHPHINTQLTCKALSQCTTWKLHGKWKETSSKRQQQHLSCLEFSLSWCCCCCFEILQSSSSSSFIWIWSIFKSKVEWNDFTNSWIFI